MGSELGNSHLLARLLWPLKDSSVRLGDHSFLDYRKFSGKGNIMSFRKELSCLSMH